ncbi:hypothetical protein [Pyrobaculum sp.]|uniref:hypothetical protein n=1 Tax=Pyrobaculum sp. TaxID=2004705 RepID=UPI00315EF9F3
MWRDVGRTPRWASAELLLMGVAWVARLGGGFVRGWGAGFLVDGAIFLGMGDLP